MCVCVRERVRVCVRESEREWGASLVYCVFFITKEVRCRVKCSVSQIAANTETLKYSSKALCCF